MRHYTHIALLISILFAVISCEVITDKLPSYAETSLVKVGDKAPHFTIESIDGEMLTMPCEVPTLLILFSHTCPDCQNMMRDLQAHLDTTQEEPKIIAISRGGTREEITAFREEYGLRFPIAADETKEIYYDYATMYVPRCYVIDSQGTIQHVTYEYAEGDIDTLMGQLKHTK